MIFGAVFDAADELSSTPNRAPVIKPEPCGSGGGTTSLAARAGLGDGALEGVAVGVLLSFFAAFAGLVGAGVGTVDVVVVSGTGTGAGAGAGTGAETDTGSESISIATGC